MKKLPIKLLFDKNNLPSARKITANPDLVKELIEHTDWLLPTASIAERIWNYEQNNKSYPKICKHCPNHITSFRSYTDNYFNDYCSVSCQRRASTKPKIPKEKCPPNEINQKRKNTSLLKFGTDFPWQTAEIKKKKSDVIKQKTLAIWKQQLQKENLKILFDDAQYLGNRTKLQVQCGECDTLFKLSRFNNTADGSSANRCPICRTTNASKPQHEINDFIKMLGFSTILNDRQSIYPLELDIFIPEINCAIEFDGLYWHSELGRPDIKHALKTKLNKLYNTDIKVLYINEFEWAQQRHLVENTIKNLLDKNVCLHITEYTIENINVDIAEEFFNTNHLHGFLPTDLYIGLVHKNRLMSAISIKDDILIQHADIIGYKIYKSFDILIPDFVKQCCIDSRIPFQGMKNENEIRHLNVNDRWEISETGTHTKVWVPGICKIILNDK